MYQHLRSSNHSKPVREDQMADAEICSVTSCGNKCRARGLCSTHYEKSRISGVPPMSDSKRGLTKKWILDHVSHKGDDCLIWPFARLVTNGYPIASCDGRHQVASRVMCQEAHGPPPEEWYEAAHTCGNGRGGCVNPSHIRWATIQENRRDKIKHGTSRRGEEAHFAKLTRRQVRSIRSMDGKVSRQALCNKYGVAPATISRIMNRTCWGWLDAPQSE